LSNDLYRLVYFSRSDLRPEELKASVEDILNASQRNNARVGVTGALMFNSGCFAQVLEGAQAAVEETFERIQRDMRHRETVVLMVEPTAHRAFSHWSMGYVGASTAESDMLSNVSETSGFDVKKLEGERVYDFLLRAMLEEAARGGVVE
jgi:blue light- and temperature-responsive anti-repressor